MQISSSEGESVTSGAPLNAARPVAARQPWHYRSRRVIVLTVGIILLSFADLIITLAYLNANWMIEANPIAAYLINSTQSPWALAAFKGLTVFICVMVLLHHRRTIASEIAAWCAVAILSVLAVLWHEYSIHFADPENLAIAEAACVNGERLGLP